ncbi:hypothetical protein [Streptomyces sp. NPDC090026]|uniref:hypothetical protein n=1 Tax=Streptomyces sp. NPDC090026 TaxID=3365923 RepID=UPI00381F093F
MDDATLALTAVTVGLDRLRDQDTAAALQTLARTGPPRASVLGLLCDLLDDLTARLGDDGLEDEAEDLSEAIGLIRGDAVPRLRRALETVLAPQP